jgi:phage terminase small subunit
MGAPTKLTPKQEAFAQAYVETGNASEAYRRAYDAEGMKPDVISVKASELLRNGKVAVRVEALQAKHAKRHDITIDALTEQLLEDRRLAYRVEQPGAAVSATMGLAKLHGLVVDRAKVDADLRVTHEQALREIQASLGDAS